MNKRIDELWGEALDKAVPDTYTSLSWTQVEKIKAVFAELIVRECIEVIDITSDNTKLMRVDPYQKIIWAIKQHFGVEE